MASYSERLDSLQSGQSAVIEKLATGGSLEARRLGSGAVMFYWRYTQEKRTERMPIGVHDPAAPPRALKPTARGFGVQAALERARDLAKSNRDVPGGLRAERLRRSASDAAEAQARVAREQHSLKALCTDYCDWLKSSGKSAHADAANIFKNHLEQAYPELVGKPAVEVEKREVVAALRRLTEAGKVTTARKLRAYLRAAYACALHADSDAAIPAKFIGYQVTVNPVEGTAAIKGQADKNPLSLPELRKYWKQLKQEDGVIGAALRLHLLTGAQRTAQLTRLKDSDTAGSVLKLLDPKGKRTEPRSHLIPVTIPIRNELGKLPQRGLVLSTDGGRTPMHSTSMSTWAQEAAAKAGISGFQLKRVRSGVETLLAEAGIPREIRGQLQSHGIGGVQDRHYDAHHYLPEKRHALETLHRALEGKALAKRSRASSASV
ncbi:tyrosine-type recombinase/integrase [Ramlibacter sp. AN1133]|uniref:tyrosine-type recombinase/integrase n=1 Tax=Ramlibacter sp. AN1133 TaxID=3133429 RepID=UPI0030C55477